jgi:potassium efflux system protein
VDGLVTLLHREEGQTRTFLDWRKTLSAAILICCVGVQLASSQRRTRQRAEATPQPTPEASPVPSPSAPTIDAPQVAAEAMQLNQRLRSSQERVVSNESLTLLETQINALKQKIGKKAQQTELAIQSGAVFTELQQSSLEWEALSKEAKSLSETLTKHASSLDGELQSLKNDQSRWLTTNDVVKGQESPPELLELTNKVVTDVGAALTTAEARRTRIVSQQQVLAAQVSIIANETEHLSKAKAESQRSLLEQDSSPLWRVQFASTTEISVARVFRSTFNQDVSRLRAFIYTKRTSLFFVALLSLVLVAIFIRLKRANVGKSKLENHSSLFQRPFSLALLVFMVAMMPLLYDAPNSAIALVNLIGIIPVTRLLKPRLTKPYQRLLLALIASTLLWPLIKLLPFATWFKRDLLALFTLGTITVFVWLGRQALGVGSKEQRRPTLTLVAMLLGLFLLMIAFFANLFGYVGLADLLTLGSFVSAYRAVTLYTVFMVVGFLLSAILQPNSGGSIPALGTDRERLGRRLTFALGVTTFLVWVHSALKLFAIREDVYGSIRTALEYQISVGSASVAISSVVNFVLTLIVGYLIASVTRSILGEAILPRLKLARGLPNAIATVTHYVLLVLIFLFALAAAGVELSKFTILTGAFGVGIGFGLQNVVNNFVSGLILLFERPVRVGDILEVKGVGGEVTKIGFRSSTVHAFDGSDLIIPNATLISEQVTNWTLTGTRRQIVMSIHVAYGNDPTKVRDLLRETVTDHPQVLDYPAPGAFFLGFGDSALNFEVRFWAPRPEVTLELKSEVALRIAAALSEAGIEVPVPQRRLHITQSTQSDQALSNVGND